MPFQTYPFALKAVEALAVPLTVSRPSGTTRQNGYGAKTLSSVAGVSGHMQPLSPREMRNVPEGQNELEWWHVWALQEIRPDDRITDGHAPTVVLQRVEAWKEGPFWHGFGAVVTD